MGVMRYILIIIPMMVQAQMNSIKVIQKVMKDKVHVPQKIRVIFAQYLDLVVVVFAAQQSACHTDGVVLLLVLTKNADVKRKL